MRMLKYLFCTSIGKKMIVGVTGLALSLFVLSHMLGNLLLLVGPEAYNRYSYNLLHAWYLYPAEVGLLLCFLVHIFFATKLAFENRAARPIASHPPGMCSAKGARFGSKSMIYTGLLVLVFTVLHLITFKWGSYYDIAYNGTQMRDLYKLVVEKFSQPLYVSWYLISLVVLGVHLSHGFSATFQSLGFASVRNPRLKQVGWAFVIVVTAGFISQPVYLFLTGGK